MGTDWTRDLVKAMNNIAKELHTLNEQIYEERKIKNQTVLISKPNDKKENEK